MGPQRGRVPLCVCVCSPVMCAEHVARQLPGGLWGSKTPNIELCAKIQFKNGANEGLVSFFLYCLFVVCGSFFDWLECVWQFLDGVWMFGIVLVSFWRFVLPFVGECLLQA